MTDRVPSRCHDCAVEPGQPHLDGCDVARCLATGFQRIQCGGEEHEYKGQWYGEHEGECGHEIWTGIWPGVDDCQRLGLWCLDRCSEGKGFVPCEAGTPGAREDLNRLYRACKWNAEAQRFELRR